MKNLIRMIAIMMVCVLTLGAFAGCGSKPADNGGQAETEVEGTEMAKYLIGFYNDAADKGDCVEIARAIVDAEALPYMADVIELAPGDYMNGFDKEVQEFTRCACFLPMIGSIPFVGYVFETDDAESLVKELDDNANLAWNICTQADEIVCKIDGDKVFYVLTPSTFED